MCDKMYHNYIREMWTWFLRSYSIRCAAKCEFTKHMVELWSWNRIATPPLLPLKRNNGQNKISQWLLRLFITVDTNRILTWLDSIYWMDKLRRSANISDKPFRFEKKNIEKHCYFSTLVYHEASFWKYLFPWPHLTQC